MKQTASKSVKESLKRQGFRLPHGYEVVIRKQAKKKK